MNTTTLQLAYGIRINGELNSRYESIINIDSLKFIKGLHEKFDERRRQLLEQRATRQAQLDTGWKPDFHSETAHIRKSEWKVAPYPADLADRRVEITGPVDRKMVINALNSGAKVFMADFEDSCAPSWVNVLEGQINLKDAVLGKIEYINPTNGKEYSLNEEVATLMVRPRGLHLTERHVEIDGQPVSGSLFDFGLFLFHNYNSLKANGSGPYFYLPKLEHYLEARWWNDVFVFAQDYLKIPQGTIRATVLIETILASFQLNEILWELKDHSAGLNCGRWDYIFSFIKRFHNQEGYVFPDRDQVTMATNFMTAYSNLVIQTCHKRGIHAMGGMAAQIPIKGDDAANEAAFAKVKADKEREAQNGHDGTWVAHPGLVKVAMDIFNKHMPKANQIENLREDITISAQDLIALPQGTITEEGLRKNINVGMQYIAAWLSGNGAAAINNLMEDAATAEISRTQVWQWLHNQASLDDGRSITEAVVLELLEEEYLKIMASAAVSNIWKAHLETARNVFQELTFNTELKEFLTTEAYSYI